MNLKRTLALMLAMILALTVFVGCAPKKDEVNDNSEISNETSSEVVSEEVPEVTATIADVHTAVKEYLGENYLPSAQMDEAMITEVLKITPDMYTEIIAEMPMISAHVDTFIAVEAAEGKAADVEAALNAYKEQLIGGFQYPSNVPKIQATQIFTVDNKVFFVMLSKFPEGNEMTEEQLSEFFKTEIQGVVDVINKTLGK